MGLSDGNAAGAAAFRALPLLGRAAALFRRDIGAYAALAFVGAAAEIALRLATGLYGDAGDDFLPKETAMELSIMALSVALGGVIDGACFAVAASASRGEQIGFAGAARAAVARALPLALSNLGVLALFSAGFLLLFVPGFIALTRYFLVVPVCMAEDLGPKAIFARSAQLSEGARWRVFAIALFSVLAPVILDYGLQWDLDARAQLILHNLATDLASAYFAILTSLAYLELRRLKEGTDNEKVAEVFA